MCGRARNPTAIADPLGDLLGIRDGIILNAELGANPRDVLIGAIGSALRILGFAWVAPGRLADS